MLYNVVLVSAEHQHEPTTGIHMSPPSNRIPPLQVVTEHLGELPASHSKFPQAVFLHRVMYMFQYSSSHLSHPLLPSLCPQVCSMSVSLLLP